MKQLIILAITAFGLVLNAQNSDEEREKIEALKVGFLTERLSLTTAEAQKFWPIYNAFEKEEDRIRQRFAAIRKDVENDNLNASKAEAHLNEVIALEKKKYELENVYLKDLKAVFPAKKILILLKSERDFHHKILNEYRSRQNKN